jgi:hypothetical protein
VLSGAASILRTSTLLDPTQVNEAALLSELGRAEFEALVDEGRGLTVDEALDFALSELDAIAEAR